MNAVARKLVERLQARSATVFRSVTIALANELALMCRRLGPVVG